MTKEPAEVDVFQNLSDGQSRRREIFSRISEKIGTKKENHQILLSGRGAHYSYIFDLGPGLDVHKLADQLLRQNIATIAASPGSDDLRVSNNIHRHDRKLRLATKFRSYLEVLASDDGSLSQLFRVYPWLTLRVVYLFLTSRLFGSKRNELDDRTDDAISEFYSKLLAEARESEEKIRSSLINYHLHGALRVRIEQKTHFPRYFKTDPYIRLTLNRVFFDEEGRSDAFEISLMVHRSGICTLTLSAGIKEALTYEEMRNCIFSSDRRLDWFKVSEPVMKKYAVHHGVIPNENAMKNLASAVYEGHRWFTVPSEAAKTASDSEDEDEDGVTVETVFEAYLGAIEEVANREAHNEWECFTTLSLGAPRCCPGSKAKAIHEDALSLLMERAVYRVNLTDSVKNVLLTNHLRIDDKELWLTAGNAVYIDWSRTEPDFTDDIGMLIPIESALMQARQLEQIDQITSEAVVRDRSLFEAQKMLAVGLQEYRRNILPRPDGGDIVDTLLERRGAHILYARLLERVKLLESLVSTRYSRMQNRRSIAISFSGFLIVLFALLPRISESMEEFGKPERWTSSWVRFADDHLGGRYASTLDIYSVIVVISIVVIVFLSFRLRVNIKHRKKFGKSVKLPIAVEVRFNYPDLEDNSTANL
ncbi:hypothetical protein [Nocardia nova]|uniref:hypothetical protein n=1 Tax=Nocardia nova TaxID=37330 RepID=UPI0011B038CB|nr:hypothetical protein [Nocardia nova]